MDRDNIRLALGIDHLPLSAVPTHAKGTTDLVLPILWADSILFQKMQHYAHGDIGLEQYLNYLNVRIKNGEILLPIYCNDVEIFDYRPGRFTTERSTHPDGEWNRVKHLLENASNTIQLEWVSPSEALLLNNQTSHRIESSLTTGRCPIPVKKQKKYNIARWAVTGRNDLWLNTLCHRIAKSLENSGNEKTADWRELCELWASDFRTHITQNRWNNAQKQLQQCLIKHDINTDWKEEFKPPYVIDQLKSVIGNYGLASISLENEGIFLNIKTPKVHLVLNLRRGLTIHQLSFISHNLQPCIGTITHGYFSSIKLGADFYSAGVIIELPNERKRITDLEPVEPTFSLTENYLEINSEIDSEMGNIRKTICIDLIEERVTLRYGFPNWKRPIGSLRLGIITLLPDFFNNSFSLSCANGGKSEEHFNYNPEMELNHGAASSTLVTSSYGLGATTGNIKIYNHDSNIQLQWDPTQCAAMPMIQHEKRLSRIYFSMLEADETSKESFSIGAFELHILGSKI